VQAACNPRSSRPAWWTRRRQPKSDHRAKTLLKQTFRPLNTMQSISVSSVLLPLRVLVMNLKNCDDGVEKLAPNETITAHNVRRVCSLQPLPALSTFEKFGPPWWFKAACTIRPQTRPAGSCGASPKAICSSSQHWWTKNLCGGRYSIPTPQQRNC
jgi:hypothetical protein